MRFKSGGGIIVDQPTFDAVVHVIDKPKTKKSPKDFNYENKRRTCDRVL